MLLYAVRHAQSFENAGAGNTTREGLTPDGWLQARRLGHWFKGVGVDHIYCSKLTRAKQTLEAMKKDLPRVPVTYTAQANEQDFGALKWDGVNAWTSFSAAARSADVPFADFTPEGGESLSDVGRRARAFCRWLRRRHSDESVIIISHGIFLAHLVVVLLGLARDETRFFELSNASVSQFRVRQDGTVSHFHVNDYHHLLVADMEANRSPKLLLRRAKL